MSGVELLAKSSTTRRDALGMELQYDHQASHHAGWELNAGGGYRHVLQEVNAGFDASYRITPNAQFHIDGAEQPRDAFWGNLGIGYRQRKDFIYARADVRFDRNQTSPGISIGYRHEL